MIAEFDAMVGMYIETVKDAGVWNNTVWVVTSDHGDMQFEHQQFYKMVPREARHNAPLDSLSRATSRLPRRLPGA